MFSFSLWQYFESFYHVLWYELKIPHRTHKNPILSGLPVICEFSLCCGVKRFGVDWYFAMDFL